MADKLNHLHFIQNGLYIWFLGQAGFVLQSHRYKVIIDPYLTGVLEKDAPEGRQRTFSRIFPPPISPDELTDVDLILVTHDHGDHLDQETLTRIGQANPTAKIVGPAHCRNKLLAAGFRTEQIVPCSTFSWHQLMPELRIYPIPAAHYNLELREGDHAFLGFVLEMQGVRVYHSGDTIIYPELLDNLRHTLPLDIALLPINGRHAFREEKGFIGNMTYQEAADLAGTLQVQLVIPMHHDLMRANSEHPANFVRYLVDHWPDIAYRVLQAGQGHFYFSQR